MHVNSAFSSFLNNRLTSWGIAIVILSIFFTTASFGEDSDRDLRAKQVNLIIREIGHRLLLQAGDATSRVLPVTEKEGTFLLRFEKEFVFNHDSLIALAKDLLPKSEFPSGYTVTVHDCTKHDIVYGFQLNNISPDNLACSGRNQPAGCYTIEFAFTDLYEKAEQKKAGIDQLTEAKTNTLGLASRPGEIKTVTSDNKERKELQSIKVDLKSVNAKPEELKTTNSGYSLINLFSIGVLVLLALAFVIWRFRKIEKPVPEQNQNNPIVTEAVPELPALGKFLFDAKEHRLHFGNEVVSLTDKECKVLELLHKNFGELIPRDVLMQKVWIDEGVITTRSLDMFVSKLRKKLSPDPQLRITNVHGKGYKLEKAAIKI
ncbi:MAG: winged helix-turn-helix transcriptional regulator [Flavisolibacter sp.]|nr:winged helix-turn-helix transcriptional regulator [Flavisolibacter sp.]